MVLARKMIKYDTVCDENMSSLHVETYIIASYRREGEGVGEREMQPVNRQLRYA